MTHAHFALAGVRVLASCRPTFSVGQYRRIEADECIPYLQRQIELVRPRVILLLGATARKHIDKSKTTFQMGEKAGKVFTLPDYPGIQFNPFGDRTSGVMR